MYLKWSSKKRKSSNRFSFQNTVANCNEDGTELIIICSKDRSNIRQWRPTPGGQTLYTLSLPSPPSQRRCRRKAERERERYVLKRILMRERVCARPRERVHDGLTRVWQARCRCYLSVMSAHLPSRREREREREPSTSLSLSLSSPSPSRFHACLLSFPLLLLACLRTVRARSTSVALLGGHQ